MGIMNKRNAVLGWAVWKFGKRMAKRKAKGAVPGVSAGRRGVAKPILAGVAALGGTVLFWRRKSGRPETAE